MICTCTIIYDAYGCVGYPCQLHRTVPQRKVLWWRRDNANVKVDVWTWPSSWVEQVAPIDSAARSLPTGVALVRLPMGQPVAELESKSLPTAVARFR